MIDSVCGWLKWYLFPQIQFSLHHHPQPPCHIGNQWMMLKLHRHSNKKPIFTLHWRIFAHRCKKVKLWTLTILQPPFTLATATLCTTFLATMKERQWFLRRWSRLQCRFHLFGFQGNEDIFWGRQGWIREVTLTNCFDKVVHRSLNKIEEKFGRDVKRWL